MELENELLIEKAREYRFFIDSIPIKIMGLDNELSLGELTIQEAEKKKNDIKAKVEKMEVELLSMISYL